MRAQSYAVDIEHVMRKVFECERFGFSGIVNSDFILKNTLSPIIETCWYKYSLVNEQGKNQIEAFINDTEFYWEMSLDDLLSFESSCKTVGIATIEIEYDNGEKALIDNNKKFETISTLITK